MSEIAQRRRWLEDATLQLMWSCSVAEAFVRWAFDLGHIKLYKKRTGVWRFDVPTGSELTLDELVEAWRAKNRIDAASGQNAADWSGLAERK